MATDYLYEQSEVVRKKLLPKWMQMKWNVATDLIDRKGEEEQIGERDYRLPFDLQNGGRVGKYDPNMGDMGRGTASKGDVMTGSYYNLRLNFELPILANKIGENKKVSQTNRFKKAIQDGVPEFSIYMDKFFHSDGTAVLATATAHTTSSGKSIYTMDTTFGIQRLRRGMYVNVYNNALSSALSSATLYIQYVDYGTRKITLSGTVASASADDKICFEGVSGASPAGLRGLYYWNSYATSGTTAGINRATEPEIIANSVNAAGGLTHEHGMLLYHKILTRRGEVNDSLVGLSNVAQQAAVFSNLMSLQTFDIAGGVKVTDRLPKGLRDKSFPFAGVPHFIDIHQDQTRLDWVDASTWVKCVLDNMKFFELPGSNQRFFHLTGGSGAPAAGVWFGLTCDMDYANVNPGNGGVVYGLSLPTLYQ